MKCKSVRLGACFLFVILRSSLTCINTTTNHATSCNISCHVLCSLLWFRKPLERGKHHFWFEAATLPQKDCSRTCMRCKPSTHAPQLHDLRDHLNGLLITWCFSCAIAKMIGHSIATSKIRTVLPFHHCPKYRSSLSYTPCLGLYASSGYTS